tara:strand:+ start:13 stop:342 length:330 start_codon:yes stop_codon:yes gene_type:complete
MAKFIVLGLGAAIAGFAFFLLKEPSRCGEDNLYALFQDEIKKQLRSPASAVFQPTSEAIETYSQERCSITVSGYVDSQNGFGALLRNSVMGVARLENGKLVISTMVMPN